MQMLSSPSSWSCFVASLPALSLLLFCDTFFHFGDRTAENERRGERVSVSVSMCVPCCCYSVPNSKCKVNKLFYSHFKSSLLSVLDIFSSARSLILCMRCFCFCSTSSSSSSSSSFSLCYHSLGQNKLPSIFLVLFLFFSFFSSWFSAVFYDDDSWGLTMWYQNFRRCRQFFEHYFLLLKKECLISQFFIQQ